MMHLSCAIAVMGVVMACGKRTVKSGEMTGYVSFTVDVPKVLMVDMPEVVTSHVCDASSMTFALGSDAFDPVETFQNTTVDMCGPASNSTLCFGTGVKTNVSEHISEVVSEGRPEEELADSQGLSFGVLSDDCDMVVIKEGLKCFTAFAVGVCTGKYIRQPTVFNMLIMGYLLQLASFMVAKMWHQGCSWPYQTSTSHQAASLLQGIKQLFSTRYSYQSFFATHAEQSVKPTLSSDAEFELGNLPWLKDLWGTLAPEALWFSFSIAVWIWKVKRDSPQNVSKSRSLCGSKILNPILSSQKPHTKLDAASWL